jgi:hypothetical protein
MNVGTNLGGTFTFPGTRLTVHRMGYGAMQLPGPGVWGPPRDRNEAIAVLHEASTARTSRISSSAKPCIPIATASSSSPRSARAATTTKAGTARCHGRNSSMLFTTTCATSA